MASLAFTQTAAFSTVSQRRQTPALRPRKFAVRAAVDPETAAANYRLTGIKTDTTGISVVDVIEPSVYVSEFGQEETSASTSAGVLLGSLFLVGASFALITLSDRAPVVGPSAPTLTQLVYKFEAEVEAAAPILEIPSTAPPPLEIAVADSTGVAEEALAVAQ